MKNLAYVLLGVFLIGSLLTASGCFEGAVEQEHPNVSRDSKLPADISKRGPSSDNYPPILHSTEYETPVPLPSPVSTSGAEDSPFILSDGNTLYFFFTPDVRVAPEKQLLDDVTGVWVTYKSGGVWSEPVRVWLQDPGKLSLDGAVCIQGSEMWFASAREGYAGVNMFTAELIDGEWMDWTYSGDRLMKEIQIGETHLYGDDLYFHSARYGGKGGIDIWVTTRSGNSWSEPINIDAVNSVSDEGYPFISSDGNEIWFTRTYRGTGGVFRSVMKGGNWGEPELMVSQFAGEPTLDDVGNLFFVHHYYEDGVMIEADIYVAYRK